MKLFPWLAARLIACHRLVTPFPNGGCPKSSLKERNSVLVTVPWLPVTAVSSQSLARTLFEAEPQSILKIFSKPSLLTDALPPLVL